MDDSDQKIREKTFMRNIQIGASLLSWVPPLWNADAGKYAIEQTAKHGFDLIEILLPNSMDFDAKAVKAELTKNKLKAVCGLNLSAEYHLPTHPREATQLMKSAVDKAAILEVDYLGGVLHSTIGVFSGHPRTSKETDTLLDVWNTVANYAQQYGITIGIEPINRYESYMCTGAQETLELIQKVEHPNLALHLDTFHMNIEETSFYTPIVDAGHFLRHIHMTESDRGMLGEGNVDWNSLFKALKAIDYDGRLVLENFSSSVPGMAEAVSLWRPSKYDAEKLAVGSLNFIRKKLEEFGL